MHYNIDWSRRLATNDYKLLQANLANLLILHSANTYNVQTLHALSKLHIEARLILIHLEKLRMLKSIYNKFYYLISLGFPSCVVICSYLIKFLLINVHHNRDLTISIYTQNN